MLLALIEDMADVNGERHEPDQMLSEEALALLCAALRDDATRGGQLDRAILEFRKLQNVQCLSNRKQVVDLEGEQTGDVGRFGMSSVGWRGQGFDEPADAIGRNLGQPRICQGFEARTRIRSHIRTASSMLCVTISTALVGS